MKTKNTDFQERLYDLEELPDNAGGSFALYFYFEGLPVPFFIEKIELRSGSAWIVEFTTVRDALHAEELVGKTVYIENEAATSHGEDLSYLKGFKLLSQTGESLGEIKDVVEYPANVCIEVEKGLVPLHPDLIISIDEGSHTLQMAIPDGLF